MGGDRVHIGRRIRPRQLLVFSPDRRPSQPRAPFQLAGPTEAEGLDRAPSPSTALPGSREASACVVVGRRVARIVGPHFLAVRRQSNRTAGVRDNGLRVPSVWVVAIRVHGTPAAGASSVESCPVVGQRVPSATSIAWLRARPPSPNVDRHPGRSRRPTAQALVGGAAASARSAPCRRAPWKRRRSGRKPTEARLPTNWIGAAPRSLAIFATRPSDNAAAAVFRPGAEEPGRRGN